LNFLPSGELQLYLLVVSTPRHRIFHRTFHQEQVPPRSFGTFLQQNLRVVALVADMERHTLVLVRIPPVEGHIPLEEHPRIRPKRVLGI
jgi:hypothetical protein